MNHAVSLYPKGTGDPIKSVGLDVAISPSAVILNPGTLEIGDNVRIDEGCIIDGGAGLKIGSHVHISAYTVIYSGAGVEIGDFATLSIGCLLLSESDDYSGASLVGPQIPRDYRPSYHSPGPLLIGPFVSIGARTTVMPGAGIAAGVAVGAHSLVRRAILDEWTIWAGAPAQYMKPRSREMIELSELFLDRFRNGERK